MKSFILEEGVMIDEDLRLAHLLIYIFIYNYVFKFIPVEGPS